MGRWRRCAVHDTSDSSAAYPQSSGFQTKLVRITEVAVRETPQETKAGNSIESGWNIWDADNLKFVIETRLGNLYAKAIDGERS